MYRIERVDAHEAEPYLDALADLLVDAVEGGASVGFLRPLDASEARAYWDGVVSALSGGERVLFVAV